MEKVEWRANLVIKGLKVDARMIVGGGVVSELGAWPCGVCSKEVTGNSL